ncbi:MAG: type II toxin-antitoxin system VapC family toxin [Moraxellaceae bacterium]|nr:type II toxin-antitoxin system VapC family toxin [Pseudomonadales bacterium]MCB1674563.1 type II toxin-antitoxin system VapC family toxin [Pseudomonadales bacterium]MCP5177085.1 type II toxin-antitoxin system VapC family toxin [Moraxellaceae bacterium]
MRFLLDTHLLLWAAAESDKLSPQAHQLISNSEHELWFSAASIWEITIKLGLDRADFRVNPTLLRQGLLQNGYQELAISSLHALAVRNLANIHKDPFDRLLVAQASCENLILLSSDTLVAQYGAIVKLV